ncbi:hybrid sensor histidine kinase/response regulator transcription factor [Flavilitoribacter nigricans]|uniref:histidine kinase n=1 Tax=Flavilitoribacter nigricans (strain ATCC 23147 / DSM 23189 / NBRC 102662 / NCIMB 1420 / SS-2) TaxID=1122177 RepID=A0A2D0N0S0_FLAN2|nr:ATP-binding protein [Flavilitoribacter nigricans]PHN02057.1 hypothetical protein CRP01_34040 [Flavilitoribacter nigricans DSM 23189 = NBRC 102662]
MPFYCFFLLLLALCLSGCHANQEEETYPNHYSVKAEKITPIPFYVTPNGDTVDISQPIRAKISLDTSYALSKNAVPILGQQVSLLTANKQATSSPVRIAPGAALSDILVHGDTLRTQEQALRGKKMKISKSAYQKLDPPVLLDNTDQAIRTLGADQGLPPRPHQLQLKDNKGNLWFTSPLSISRYDGVSMSDYILPSSGLNGNKTLFQDSRGNIWIGTQNKIIQYNGTDLTVYDKSDFGDTEFAEDQRGNIWFASGGSLSYLKDSTLVRFTDLDQHGLIAKKLWADTRGHIWVSAQSRAQSASPTRQYLLLYDGKNIRKIRDSIPQVTSMPFSSIQADNKGNIWMLGVWQEQTTLVKYDGTYFYQYQEVPGFDRNSPSADQLFLAGEDRMIIKRSDGKLIDFDGMHFDRIHLDTSIADINGIILDDAGNRWFTVSGNPNLYVYSAKKFEYFDQTDMQELGMADPNSFMDRKGRVWWKNSKATQQNGWSVLSGDTLTNLTFPESIKNPFWSDSDGGIWDKGENGVSRYSNGLVETIPSSGAVERIAEDNAGNFWIPTADQHLHMLTDTGLLTTTYEQDLFESITGYNMDGILVDSRQQFWTIGKLNSNIARFDGTYWTYFRFPTTEEKSLKFNAAIDPIEDNAGNIWFILGKHALLKYDGEAFWTYNFDHLSEISTFIKDDKGRIWLTTTNDGIGVFDGQQLQLFSQREGLLDNQVYSIYKDFDNRIWVTSVNGISIVEEKSAQNFAVLTIGKADGLTSNFFPLDKTIYFSEDKQKAYIRALSGVAFLITKDLQSPESPPRDLSLCQIDINQQFIDFGRLIEYESILDESYSAVPEFLNYPNNLSIPHYLNHLTFYFTAHNWEAPHKIRYSFKIKDIDQDWSLPQAEPSIDYRNLTYGQHTLLVRAKNELNSWSEPFAYQFSVRPPWWRSGWAYSLYCLIIGTVLYWIFHYFRARLRLQNALALEQQEAKRLKELDTFKSRLYTNITHEFRTPLTVILGMTDQIQENPKSFLGEGLHLIKNNGRNLLRLINQILDLSKIEDQSFSLKLEQDNIVAYLSYLTESFRTFVNSKNLALEFSSDLESLIMDYDPEQVKQVMTNLLSNAIKFTPPEGLIRVALSREHDQLLIKVSDTGIGISQKDLPQIFDRFYQVDNSATRREEGTGIGLAHTLQLVKLMGGNIEVESQVGEGTAFIITLPIARNSPLAPHTDERPAIQPPTKAEFEAIEVETSAEEEDAKKRPQLLIIEDNHDVIRYLQSCLADNYQIVAAYNGKSGIEKALENIPDLIISDIMMPEKDGFEVCDALKNDERTSHIPIILLTAKADEPSRIKGLRRGADAYLLKPFNKEELLVRVAVLVERQRKLIAYFRSLMTGSEAQIPAGPFELEEEAITIENAFLQKIKDILEENYQDEQFNLPELCQEVGMSRSQLFRKLKGVIDQSPSHYIRSFRLAKAKYLLEHSEFNVNEVTWKTGFSNPSHFSKIFKKEFGISPSDLSK